MSQLISYVVPVFNIKSDYLSKCIDSLLSDTSLDVEVLLIDDCSTNGCDKLCDDYQIRDNRVKVFHQKENRGVSNARNFGVRQATGEWIAFVDADDWIEVDTRRVLLPFLSDAADVILFSACRESANRTIGFGVSDAKKVYGRNAECSEDEKIDFLSDNLLKQSLIKTPKYMETVKYCWGKVFRKDFLISKCILFPDISYCEDIVFMAEVLQKADRILQIPSRLYHYRISATSTVNSYRSNAIEEQKLFLECLEKIIGRDSGDTIYYAALLSMQICITRFFFNSSRKAGIIQRSREARMLFSCKPYSDVAKHIDYSGMKKSEKLKALLIKNGLYYLYYLGTEVGKTKSKRYK